MDLKVKKLHPDAQLPTRGSAEAAGLDLYTVESATLIPGERRLLKLGIAVSFDPGYYLRVAPRSGLSLKQGLDVLAGVVDSDYRGELAVILVNLGQSTVTVNKGDRIAQGIVTKIELADVVETDDLDATDRGAGGYGSTGR